MNIAEIANIIDASPPLFKAKIAHLVTDSRRILLPEQSLFFAFTGMRQNGHDFIEDAYSKGIRNFIISEKVNIESFPDANFLLVSDVHAAIHQLARFHRQQFHLPVIGITGSNGKTIIKEWLFQILQEDFRIVRSPRSYNSQLGVPLSIWQIQQEHELGIFEAGISQMSEMEKIAPIIDCSIGIFTNIGEAHREGFPSKALKIQEKLQLFEQTKTIVYCMDHEQIHTAMQRLKDKHFFTWTRDISYQADLKIIGVERLDRQTQITAIYQSQEINISIPFTDEPSIENAIHCWAVALHLGLSSQRITQKMQQLESVAMRLEMRAGINQCSLINDSYNSDLTSLGMALNFLERQGKHKQRTLILSDILQSGQDKQTLYSKVAKLIAAKRIQKFIGIGQAIHELNGLLPTEMETYFFKDTSSFLQKFEHQNFQREAILLKAARRFQFERIANFLSKKVHRTVLEVNLKAVLHNLNVFSTYLKPSTKTCVMVKAAAYGSGSVEIARLLEFQNIDYLAVAYADEGVELREAGIQLPILVLNPEEATFETHIRYTLEPEIYTLEQLKQFIRFLPENTQIKIHLKLDTGMHRLGFEEKDLPQLLPILQSEPRLYVQSAFSHLAGSDEAVHNEFTTAQVSRYSQLYEQIAVALGYRPIRHILNTSGIVRFPQYQFDMVRLGIGLYGVEMSNTVQSQLQTVSTLKARISQIKQVEAQETVGYSRRGKVQRRSRSATVSIGYADGLARLAGNGNYSMLIRGQRAPILGSVCMDMCMLDVTDIPEAKEGDEVIVFGENPSVYELSEALQTIPFEIFTNISQRVKRVYFEE